MGLLVVIILLLCYYTLVYCYCSVIVNLFSGGCFSGSCYFAQWVVICFFCQWFMMCHLPTSIIFLHPYFSAESSYGTICTFFFHAADLGVMSCRIIRVVLFVSLFFRFGVFHPLRADFGGREAAQPILYCANRDKTTFFRGLVEFCILPQ